MIGEMARVARPGSTVAWWLATASSFGEFFSIYWEALLGAGLDEHGADVEKLIVERPTIRDAEQWVEHAGLDGVTSGTNIEEFDFESGEQFFNLPVGGECSSVARPFALTSSEGARERVRSCA